MSQIDSTLNSASTLVTMDFIHPRWPDLDPKTLMRIGQISTAIFMLLATLWAPQIERFGSIFKYLQDILAFAVGPVIALFVIGVFWKRANALGAHCAILAGVLVAIALFVAKLLELIAFNNLYAAPVTLAASALGLVLGSLQSPPPPTGTESLIWTPQSFEAETEELSKRPRWQNFRIQSVALILTTALIIGFWV